MFISFVIKSGNIMKSLKSILFVSSIFCSNFCFSGSYSCYGKIDNLFITRPGNVEVYSTEIYGNTVGRMICNTTSSWKGVSPDTCKVWVSTILAQIAQKKSTKIYYLTEDSANCTSLLTYDNSPSPWGISEN